MNNKSKQKTLLQKTFYDQKASSFCENKNSINHQQYQKQQQKINLQQIDQHNQIFRDQKKQLHLQESSNQQEMRKLMRKDVKKLLSSSFPWTDTQVSIYINTLQDLKQDFHNQGNLTKLFQNITNQINKEFIFFRTINEIKKLHQKMIKNHKSIDKIIENGLQWYKKSDAIKKQPAANNPLCTIACFNFKKQQIEYLVQAVKKPNQEKKQSIQIQDHFLNQDTKVKFVVGIPVKIAQVKNQADFDGMDFKGKQKEPQQIESQN